MCLMMVLLSLVVCHTILYIVKLSFICYNAHTYTVGSDTVTTLYPSLSLSLVCLPLSPSRPPSLPHYPHLLRRGIDIYSKGFCGLFILPKHAKCRLSGGAIHAAMECG